MSDYETPDARVQRLLLEINQFKIVDRNHREYCTFEIKRRQTEIEILLASEVKAVSTDLAPAQNATAALFSTNSGQIESEAS